MEFDFGNILTRTLQITWKHKVFWGILTLPVLISFAIFPFVIAFLFLFQDASANTEVIGLAVFFVLFILFLIAASFLQVFCFSAVTLGIVRIERGEGSLKFTDLLHDGREYFWRQFGIFLIVQLSFGLVISAFSFFILAATVVSMGMAAICLQPFIILIMPLSFLVIAVLESANVAVITESLGSWEAVKRGAAVVREHIWKYVLLTILIYFGTSLLISLIMFPMFIPFFILPLVAESANEMTNTSIMVMMITFACIFFPVTAFVSGITQTVMKTALGLTYLRLTRKDENQVIVSEA